MLDVFSALSTWELFAILGILLCVAEIFIPGFVAFPIGCGFLIAALLTFGMDNIFQQWLILGILEFCVFIYLVKTFSQKKKRSQHPSNMEATLGKECELIEAVSPQKMGYVKLYGDQWQAMSFYDESFEVGERAIIEKIVGNKVFIRKF